MRDTTRLPPMRMRHDAIIFIISRCLMLFTLLVDASLPSLGAPHGVQLFYILSAHAAAMRDGLCAATPPRAMILRVSVRGLSIIVTLRCAARCLMLIGLDVTPLRCCRCRGAEKKAILTAMPFIELR